MQNDHSVPAERESEEMRILILGGDGYLGWPTAMHLSAAGHDICVADNYLRRRLARELDVEPLWEPPNLHQRARIWKDLTGKEIQVHIGDVQEWGFLHSLVRDFGPNAIIHYAEQPSAPYSMAGHQAARLTLSNNLGATFNVIYAVKEVDPSIHITKIGTMGEYGTPNIDIEEGWIDIEHKGRRDRFLYPRQASSLYHTTKIMDTDLLWFYVRTWGLRATDLMQGPVYGIFTDECRSDSRLLPFFNYDEIFGTVINRFVVQAVAGFPLTVYGRGGQTRGYINLVDTLECVRLSVENPASPGELRIFNQFTEQFTVNQAAELVVEAGKNLGLDVRVDHVDNPRKEAEEHYYNAAHSSLLELGLKPHLLNTDVLQEMMEKVLSEKSNIDKRLFLPTVRWESDA